MNNKMVIRYCVIIFIGLLSAAFGFCAQRDIQTVDKPYNVILISIDTLRADHLGCYGYSRNTSPNIDVFSRTGVIFKNFFCNFPSTLPSHMSIFTSLYPDSHNVIYIFKDSLDNKIVTLPQILKAYGYKTVWSGPLNDPHLSLESGFAKGFDEFIGGDFVNDSSKLFSYLEQYKNHTFFIFMHTNKLHYPYFPKQKVFGISGNGKINNTDDLSRKLFARIKELFISDTRRTHALFGKEAALENKEIFSGEYSEEKLKKIYSLAEGHSVYSPITLDSWGWDIYWGQFNLNHKEDLNYLIDAYDSCIFDVDRAIADVISELTKHDLIRKTIIIITSDHGESFMEHGDIKHGSSLYNEQIRIPLIINLPEDIIEPKEVNSSAQSIDILPTILDLAGIMRDKVNFQGRSLFPLASGNSSIPETDIYVRNYSGRAIYSKEWKFISNTDKNDELYNLIVDKYEKNNLLVQENSKASNLKNKLYTILARQLKQKEHQFQEGLTKEVKKKIKKEGYW